jgi:hypothetical protein
MRLGLFQFICAPGRSCRAGIASIRQVRDRAARHLLIRLAIALLIGAAAVSSRADDVQPEPVIVLPHDIVLPVPRMPPTNADPMNPNSPGDVLTQRNNNLRTGTTLHGGLDQTAVSDPRFGLLGHLDVRGAVLAQPLFVANVDFKPPALHLGLRSAVFIADSMNWVYAFDAVTLEKLWEKFLGDPYVINDPWNSSTKKKFCPELMIAPQDDNVVMIGIESTPVIDLERSRIIVSYRMMDGIPGIPGANGSIPAEPKDLLQDGEPSSGAQRIAALDLRNGQLAQENGQDLDRRITDVAPTINPAMWNQVHRNRASLLLDGGHVYVAFAGMCEEGEFPLASKAYQGWVYALDASTLAFAGLYRSTQKPDGIPPQDPTDDPIVGGGIWQATTGLAADGHGNLYFTTGNQGRCAVPGDNAAIPCSPPDPLGKNLSNSVVRLRVDPEPGGPPGSISMTPADWFTPYRKTWLDNRDLDFAAAGVVLIPNTRYLVAGGKEGMLYVLDRDHLGKFDGSVPFDASTVAGPNPPFHTSGDPVGLDNTARDQVVQKFRAAENQYCAADPSPLFCLSLGQDYPSPATRPPGVTMNDWIPWPHIHGTPVFGAFPDGRAFLYLWAEKDFLKSFRWWGRRFETTPTQIATNKAGAAVLAPPYLAGTSVGMPGGMLALSINPDPTQPPAGVLFASVERCRGIPVDDPRVHECSVEDCQNSSATLSICGQQRFGMLRAFDPFTLHELWSNQQFDPSASDADKNYWIAKFVPPTIAHGRVFLATGSKRVLVYGMH